MKILFICEFFPVHKDLKFSGGVESYSFHLIKELSQKHQITVITTKLTSESEDLTNKNLKVIRVGLNIKNIESSFSSLPKRFIFQLTAIRSGLKQDFDLVQGDNFITHPVAFLVGFLKRKPTVAFYADVFIGKWFSLSGITGLFGEFSERLNLNFPWSKIIALSLSTKAKLKQQNIKEENIEVIYGGVDLNFFNKISIKKNSNFTIIYVGRLVSYKRVDVLINSINLLKQKNVFVDLVVVGVGPEKNNLDSLVDRLNISSQVVFKENISRENLVREFKKSHLFVLPSTEEGFGLVIIEAAAAGIPYIVSDLPVLKEITKNGLGGDFFKINDPQDLAKKIEKYMTDPVLRKRLKTEISKLARFYKWPGISSQYEEVYAKLVNKKLKVLMLVDAWFPHMGGGQVHAWELSKKLADLGCEIIIYTRNLGKWSATYPGIDVKRIGSFKKFSQPLGRLEYLIRALIYSLIADYDILHAHAFSPGLIVPFVKLFRDKAAIFTAHGRGLKIAGFGINGSFLQDIVFYKIFYDTLITVAKESIDKTTKSTDVVVIPNGVNIARFIPAQRKRLRVTRLLYVGRITYDKGVDLLIDSFRLINRKNLNLTIIGEGPLVDILKEKSKSLGVEFKGKLEGEKLVLEFRKADLLILPSLVEGFPIRILEGWASKLPILATKVGENSKIIKDGFNGFLCDPNVLSIKDKLKSILKNENLNHIGENAYLEINKYSWENIANQTLNVYKQVLRKYEKS